MINHLLFRVAVLSLPYHFEPMRKFIAVMIGLLLLEACSPPDEHSPSPEITPIQNKKGMPENNTSAPPKTDDNKTQSAATQPASELARFLTGKQINLEVPNNSVKLAPKFEANGTWVNTVAPKQRGPYTVLEDGRVILNLPDKSRLTLFINGNTIKPNDMVNVLIDDTLIQSTVETIE